MSSGPPPPENHNPVAWALSRLQSRTQIVQEPLPTQEYEDEIEDASSEAYDQHHGPQLRTTQCSWCEAVRHLQTVQHHRGFGDLYLCGTCTAVWRLWSVVSRAPTQLERYITDSILAFAEFWEGLISTVWELTPQTQS